MILQTIEDTKWVIGIRKSKQDRQYNMANGKEQMNNDLQNTTQQNGATRIHNKRVLTRVVRKG